MIVMNKTKLIIGAAGKPASDAVTLDINPAHHPDVVCDLNTTPWPFATNQFQEIICHHVLEHLDGLDSAMKELHRICSPEGVIYIEVPHFSSYMANSPEHKLRFSFFSLDSYLASGTKSWHITDFKFMLVERKITFHRAYRRYFLHKLFNRSPLSYERFWTYIFPAEHLIFKIQPVK